MAICPPRRPAFPPPNPALRPPQRSAPSPSRASFTCHLRAGVGARVCCLVFHCDVQKPSTSSAQFFAAPGFRRLKMTRATMNTFNKNWKRRWLWWQRRRRRRRWWGWWLCVVGSLLLELQPSAPSTPRTKGKRLGQHACIGRVAQGKREGGMRALGVFENYAESVLGV